MPGPADDFGRAFAVSTDVLFPALWRVGGQGVYPKLTEDPELTHDDQDRRHVVVFDHQIDPDPLPF